MRKNTPEWLHAAESVQPNHESDKQMTKQIATRNPVVKGKSNHMYYNILFKMSN